MEIWEILDENGNKTGDTMIKGQQIPEGYYHLGADVWIINSEGKILIQKRSPQKRKEPNVWAMTGGSVIKGETSLQAMQREILEELGITINESDLKLVKRFKTGTVWIDTYLLEKDINLDDVVMQEEEVSDVKWATYDEIEELVSTGNFIKNRWEFVKDLLKK